MLQELVQPSVDFYFRSGQMARSVSDLLLILIDMSDEEFLDHLHKSSFSAWVDRMLRNASLTERVKSIQSKRELIQILKDNMRYKVSASEATYALKPGVLTMTDFDLDSGHMVKVPSKLREVELWEKQFFEDTQRGFIPKAYVKEFLYGASAGFFLGLVIGGVLYRVR
ncbi:MAG TPA: hypothetical protein VJG90_06420 [Candidatus Nanoarchaeia archaeon]|nr:hypothetical protein [Candidatus Nanoarchaeia archaeon]